MSSGKYVWRLVVDSWPTENGLPFSDQDFDYWAGIVNAFQAGEPVPSWLPDDFEQWIWTDPNGIQRGYLVGDYEPADWQGGDPGWDERLLCVPYATSKRYFTPASLPARLADLRAWGCEAHIERAAIGEWETFE
ncbi:hypothetical protein [Nocardia africana]